ncbi:MAG: hypothetical protein CMJ47_10250 [Planctomyces sp.]|nr:hypothetical protein [Planctomyces sp.]
MGLHRQWSYSFDRSIGNRFDFQLLKSKCADQMPSHLLVRADHLTPVATAHFVQASSGRFPAHACRSPA